MPSFANTLVGIGPLCDAGCYVTFSNHDVTIYNPHGRPILTGWINHTITPKLWRFALQPHPTQVPTLHAATETASLTAFSAYDLTSVGALVRYLHVGLTYTNASKYFPQSAETIKVHMTQSQQGVQSTKPKPPKLPISPQSPLEYRADESITINDGTPTYELHAIDKPVSKLYSDDCGRFPINYCSGEEYIMISYHRDYNTILQASFHSRSNKHRIPDFNPIMERLRQRGHKVNHHIMDN